MNENLGLEIENRETVDLLKQLIHIKSMSGSEGELAEFVGAWLEKQGMRTSLDRHGNLYAEYRFIGNGREEKENGPVILFNTHLDNVPTGEGWEVDPFAAIEEAGVIYGRGACDPKGAMAAMMIALKAVLKAAKQPELSAAWRGTILFMGAAAEEISPPSAKGTWKAVKDGIVKADMAICGEPTNNVPCIGEFGKLEYELITHGRPAHASAPEKGANAILHMAHLLTALDEKAERRWSDLLRRKGTLNVGMISGGVQINIVPETAKAAVERRLVPGQTAEESLNELIRICDEVKGRIPQLSYEIRVVGEGNAAVIAEDEPVTQMICESVRDITGKRPEVRGFTAHADADWLITYGKIPTVIYGPGALSDAHTCHEQVTCAELTEASRVLTQFLDKALRYRL